MIIVSVHVRYFSFFSFFSLCQTGYIRLRRLRQFTSEDGTWSSTKRQGQDKGGGGEEAGGGQDVELDNRDKSITDKEKTGTR